MSEIETTEDLIKQIRELSILFKETKPTDPKTIEQYVLLICKGIYMHAEQIGATTCRQLLADAMKMPIRKPSYCYSSLLWAATKMAQVFTEFHFVPFLNLWNPTNLREEDRQTKRMQDGKLFPSLEERMVRFYFLAHLLRPEEQPTFDLERRFGFHDIKVMLVTRVKQADVKGRKMYFVKLMASDGTEAETELHTLRTNPLATSTKKNYVNVGQIYDVILKDKEKGDGVRVVDAFLSRTCLTDIFQTESGYVEHIDVEHSHIHIYDGYSRHFVSSGQKFINAQKGTFVSFVPVIPAQSKFKSAIIVTSNVSQLQLADEFPLREIWLTHIEESKGYAVWELTDKDSPVTEHLSQLQISLNETSPSCTSGTMGLDMAKEIFKTLAPGTTAKAVVFLKRGKDGQKRPTIRKNPS